MKKVSRYLLGVVTQSLQGGSPAQHHIINCAIECTWALLECYMYAQYKSHSVATLNYMEDALHRFHTFKDVFLLRWASNKAKAKGNGLRTQICEEAKQKQGNKYWNLHSVLAAVVNGHLEGLYQPRDRCFKGVRCQFQLFKDPLAAWLGQTDSSIWSRATVFWQGTWTST